LGLVVSVDEENIKNAFVESVRVVGSFMPLLADPLAIVVEPRWTFFITAAYESIAGCKTRIRKSNMKNSGIE
jgi:hypothetical protein